MISLIVPTIERKWLANMLANVRANTLLPDEVIIIDNGASAGRAVSDICEQFPDLHIRYLPQPTNLMVNASWNLGVAEAKYPIVSIFNDDILFSDTTFQKIQLTFDNIPLAGMVVPTTVHSPESILHKDKSLPIVRSLERRQGWCMSLRRDIIRDRPIPTDKLQVFFGDDYYERVIREAGYWLLRIDNAHCFHYVGVSGNLATRAALGLPPIDKEREAWSQIMSQGKS
jgi:GT2 family glycosyltransferase